VIIFTAQRASFSAARKKYPFAVLILLFATLPSSLSHAGNFFAAKLSFENIQHLPPGGLDAVGGLGDWFMTNGTLCAVISAADHPTYLSLSGGALVDLWHCQRANDQWSVAHGQFNLGKEGIAKTQSISAGHTPNTAWIEVLRSRDGLLATQRYTLGKDEAETLSITTTIERAQEGAALGMFGSMILHPGASLTPFTLDTIAREFSQGFDHPAVDTTKPSSVIAAVQSANLQVLIGSRFVQPSISYAVHIDAASHKKPGGKATPTHTFLMSGQDFSMFGAFTQSFPFFWPRHPGLVSFALGQLFDLDIGEEFTFSQSILVSERADAASFTDSLYQGFTVSGTLDTNEAGITVLDSLDTPLTFVRPSESGAFSFRLPTGIENAKLQITTPWGDTQHDITASSSDLNIGKLATGAVGILTLP